MIFPQEGWVLENFGSHVDEQKIIRASANKRETVINIGGMIMLIMCKLVDGDEFPILGEHHCSKNIRV